MSKKKITMQNPPEDVLKSVHAGDVKSLKELLALEHKKRMPGAAPPKSSEENAARFLEQPDIEKDRIEGIMKISAENDLAPDWVFVRALKVYVREYERTGRL